MKYLIMHRFFIILINVDKLSEIGKFPHILWKGIFKIKNILIIFPQTTFGQSTHACFGLEIYIKIIWWTNTSLNYGFNMKLSYLQW